MEEKKVSEFFEEIKGDVSTYVADTVEYAKLEVYEKVSLSSAVVTYGLLLAGVSLFAFLFIFVSLGFYLAELLQSDWQGFGIVALAAIVIVLLLLLIGKSLKNTITNAMVRFLMKKDDANKINN